MPEKGKYLYCIIEKKQPKKPRTRAKLGAGLVQNRSEASGSGFEIKGIEGKDVYTISEGRLSAVVSDSEIKEFFISRENLLAHQKVIEEIFKKYEVLPVSFGTVVKSSKDIKEKILKPKAKELQKALKETRGKIELGLKAFWVDIGSIFQEIIKNSKTIQSLKKSKSLSYQEKISAGELVAKLLNEKRETEKEKILDPLKKIAEDFKENKILKEDMIFNGVFLVSKKEEKKFDREINSLGKKYSPRIKFMYIGPLPLFNFVNIAL